MCGGLVTCMRGPPTIALVSCHLCIQTNSTMRMRFYACILQCERAILCNNAVHFDPVAKTWIEMKAIFLKVIFSSAVKIHWGKTQRVRNGKKSRENVNQLKFLSFGFMSQSFNTKYVLFNVLKIHFDDKCFQSNEVQHNHILFGKLCSSECWKIYYKRIFFGGESRRQDVLCMSLWYSHSKPLEFVIFFARAA